MCIRDRVKPARSARTIASEGRDAGGARRVAARGRASSTWRIGAGEDALYREPPGTFPRDDDDSRRAVCLTHRAERNAEWCESPSLSRKPRGHAYPTAHRAGWASRSDRVRRNAPNSRGRSSAGPEARRALGERRHRFFPVDPADRTRRITTRKHPARQDARDRGVPRAILDLSLIHI